MSTFLIIPEIAHEGSSLLWHSTSLLHARLCIEVALKAAVLRTNQPRTLLFATPNTAQTFLHLLLILKFLQSLPSEALHRGHLEALCIRKTSSAYAKSQQYCRKGHGHHLIKERYGSTAGIPQPFQTEQG